MNLTQARKIVGRRTKVREMVRALKMHRWLNTDEEDQRLKAGEFILESQR